MRLKVFIIIFNRLEWPKKLSEYLSGIGFEVILIDNHSDYMPLIEWYMNSPFKVHRMEKNYLSNVLWTANIINEYEDQYFAVTDCDLDLTGIPTDFPGYLLDALIKTDVWKAGLSLEIDDLPENEYTKKVIDHEKMFWAAPVDPKTGFYKADIATTFAIYDRKKFNGMFLNAIRAPRPYTAKHLPWYLTKDNLNDEQRYYINTSQWNGWDKLILS